MVSLLPALQKPSIRKLVRYNYLQNYTEFIAFCPHCKNMETILFRGDVLTGERRYSQYNDYVYHDCGADKPCRLYGPR